MNIEKYNAFIDEQKDYFNQNLQSNFKWNWNDSSWYGGTIGSGWLLSRSGKTHFTFGTIKKLKGIENNIIGPIFQEFIKSVLILSYRKSNAKASPQKLYAEFLILKRWYSALYAEKIESVHPCQLSTLILNKSFEVLAENSSKTNLPDHAGTYLRLQEMLNHYGFTEQPLEFSQKYLYINRQNRTPNAKKTKALIDQLELDEDDLDKEKLISVRTFINIVSLISLCETNGEKIVLNLLLLLIVTGLRSTEAILLKTDALIKQPILDPVTKEHLILDGKKQYTLGIQYHGAKGAGFRIHWVEPLSANLVETIFQSVLELSKEYREHLHYIRSKHCLDFLPQKIDDIPEDYVEIDDLIDTVFGVKDTYRGHAGKREVIIKTLKNIPMWKEYKQGRDIKKYYLKIEINAFVKSLASYDSEYPIDHVFNYEGKTEKIAYEDLLFIHEFRSATLQRAFINKTNIIPLNGMLINSFFGNSLSRSVFEKYNLLENETEHSKLTSHIPRHNINTFLALSGLAEHLQAMLMGRVDIKQNQYYQHLALKQRKVTASLLEKQELVLYENAKQELKPEYPIDSIKDDGLMYFSEKLDLENNLKMNLQTFDSKNEVASYVKESFFDEYFQDIAESFNELVKEDQSLANSLVQRHACLHPLPFGGCMREVAVHDCPKRLACQSGDQCGNFALTGRKGELEVLQHTLNEFLEKFSHIEQIVAHDLSYREMLEDLRQKILYLSDLKTKALDRQNSLIPIPVFPYGDAITKLPTTLSELFAIEQQKIESKEA
jgi:integrase